MSIISISSSSDENALTKLNNCMRSGKVCVLYYANWCGYCQQLKPEWDKFKDMHKNYNNSGKFHIADIESSVLEALKSKMSDLQDMIKVEGYPTISMYDNGKKIGDYQGERTADVMMTNMNNTFTNIISNEKKTNKRKKHKSKKHNSKKHKSKKHNSKKYNSKKNNSKKHNSKKHNSKKHNSNNSNNSSNNSNISNGNNSNNSSNSNNSISKKNIK